MKDRHISTYDFLNVLQQEWMSAKVRSKFYHLRSDKIYFWGMMKKKRVKIDDLAGKNTLPTIFSDKEIFNSYWFDVVNKFGFPNLSENEPSEKKFFYTNTVVFVTGGEYDGETMIVDHYDFDTELVYIYRYPKLRNDKIISIHKPYLKRLTTKQTDIFYYYALNTDFKIKLGNKIGIGVLVSISLLESKSVIRLKGQKEYDNFGLDEIARIL